MSVFRFGSVGPKFELKVFLERKLHGSCTVACHDMVEMLFLLNERGTG